jgi:hypothetical protein
VSGHADLLPSTIKTIAVPAFENATTRYKLTDRMAIAIQREFISRTRYRIVPDPNQADAVLRGAILNYTAFPTTSDSRTGRAAGVEVHVLLSLTLHERATGKVLFTRPAYDVRERYEISTQPQAYFEESDTALDRMSRQVARAVVSAVLESF